MSSIAHYQTSGFSPNSYPNSLSALTHKQQNSVLGRQFKHSRDFSHGMIVKPRTPTKTQSQRTLKRTDSIKLLYQCYKNTQYGATNNKFYQTEKAIKANHPSDYKTQIMYQTSSTMKDIENVQPRLRIPSIIKRENNKKQTRGSLFSDKNRKVNGDWFQVIKQLGKGKYGKVYLVREKLTGYLLALKAIEKKVIIESNLLDQFLRQIKIQFFLNHPSIIKLYGFFDDLTNFYLLMQLGCDGQLYDKISDHKVLSQESSSFIARSLLEVTDYMHKQKVIHRDIKPQNIVLILGNLKICDFGWAVHNNTQLRSTFCGTPLYFSPELLSGQEYDEKVDLWAIGILIFELMVGKSPFNLKQPQDLSRIITHQIDFPKNIQISFEAKSFLRNALEKDPSKRATSDELLATTFIRKFLDIEVCQQLCWVVNHENNRMTRDKASFKLNR